MVFVRAFSRVNLIDSVELNLMNALRVNQDFFDEFIISNHSFQLGEKREKYFLK